MQLMKKIPYRSVAVGLMLAGAFSVASVQAAALSLPALPSGCRYIQNSLTPMTTPVKVEVSAPQYSVLGNNMTEILSAGVQCDAPTAVPVNIGVKTTGNLQWVGPGNDILPTNAKGVGLRLYFEGQTQGGQCTQAGWLGAGNSALKCTTSQDSASQVRFRLMAQLVKTGNDTPVTFRKALTVSGGDVLVTGNDVAYPLLAQGIVSPVLTTSPSCTIVMPTTSSVDFGKVERPQNYDNSTVALATAATELYVECQPARDADNEYKVAVTFQGDTMNTDYTGHSWPALKTSMPDLAVLGLTMTSLGVSYPVQWGSPELLDRDDNWNEAGTGKSRFSYNVDKWQLLLVGGQPHDQSGPFTATATYTITVE